MSQTIKLLDSGHEVSFRGLSVVSEKILWVSGTEGTVGKSTDGGKHWNWMKVPGHKSRDFRDIEAFDANTAIIIAVGEPGLIMKTMNGGLSWTTVYRNDTPGMFLNAMEFWNPQSGIVVGDPLQGKFFVARTFDGGATWTEIPFANLPPADSGEVCFAASGTNVRPLDRDEACFVSGGARSRLFWKNAPVDLPLASGTATSGANSVAVWNKKKKPVQIAVVGGDFTAPDSAKGSCTVSRDGGLSWITPSNLPNGYRSCVEYIDASTLITCGMNGVDLSMDGGINWNAVSDTGFHVCRKAKKGKAVFLAGANGRIGKLEW